MLRKIFLVKREISLLHLLMLLTSKLLIGISVGLMFSDFVFPYSYPLLVIGLVIFLPGISYLFKEERKADKFLKRKLGRN